MSASRQFRFAAGAGGATDLDTLVQRARQAESLGYATFLISDHLLDQLAPLIALTAVAAATTTLRIGTFVLNNDLRHPAVLAQELASLDRLSGGRLEIGLGAGWNADEYVAAGLPFESHAARFRRMTESLTVLKGLLNAGPFSYAGTYYRIAQMDGRPKPLQQPHPPILVGGGGQRTLSLAGREAQIVGLAPRLPGGGQADVRSCLAPATDEKIGWVRAAAGARFADLELNTYGALGAATLTDDARGAAQALAERLEQAYGVALTPEELLDSPHVFYGTVDQLVQKCHALRERFGITYIYPLGDPVLFAPVIERLV